MHKLVWRTCKCGCDRKWRTMATSRWWYWNYEHAKKDGVEIKVFVKSGEEQEPYLYLEVKNPGKDNPWH